MKKKSKILLTLLTAFITIFSLVGCRGGQSTEGKVKVRLNEVTRSVFYAPMYIAMSEGFFEENGIEIDLQTGQGADKVMQAVLSNSADVGFCGPEQVIYINNQGREDYPIVFAQLTQKDGSFLVGRSKIDNFKWIDIKGSDVIGGRPGGAVLYKFLLSFIKEILNFSPSHLILSIIDWIPNCLSSKLIESQLSINLTILLCR